MVTLSSFLINTPLLRLMSTEKFTKSRILNGEYSYKALRNIVSNDGGNYPTQLARDLEKGGREEAQRFCSKLQDMGVLVQGKSTNAQYYVVSSEGLSDLFCDVWNVSPDLPPEKFPEFLHRYVYLYDKGDSSIRKMLREDFAEAAVSYRRQNESWPEGLQFLDDIPGLEGFVPVQDYFERAVEDVFD